jgi:2-methylcitrate dehydratase
VGLDHVILVKLASALLVTQILGGTTDDLKSVASQVFLDGSPLRTYRHVPNTGSRKSWAAADAVARAVFLAQITLKGEMGYPSVLSVPVWGFQDVCFKGEAVQIPQNLGFEVMEQILFKIAYPAEFHGQTAVEAAIVLHDQIKDKLNAVQEIKIHTQRSGMRIIHKTGPLHNSADRDHCIEYMVACGLLFGELKDTSYTDAFAQDTKIDFLREKMLCVEDPLFSKDYLDPSKRSIANRLEITMRNGDFYTHTIEYPLGHRVRRVEGIPLLIQKYKENLASGFRAKTLDGILRDTLDEQTLVAMPVEHFLEIFKDIQ